MSGSVSNPQHEPECKSDPQLSALLCRWRSIEPRAGFEDGVWHRIRAAAGAETRRPSFWTNLREGLTAAPVWVPATAALLGIALGIWTALAAPLARPEPLSAVPLLQAQTLAGAYLTMASGATP